MSDHVIAQFFGAPTGGHGPTKEEVEAWEEAESQRAGSTDTDADSEDSGSVSSVSGDSKTRREDADEAESDDEGDGSEDYLKFVCGVCDYVTAIETPKRKTDHWCRGECDAFRTFYREDHSAVGVDD
jgi:hypothetical protein